MLHTAVLTQGVGADRTASAKKVFGDLTGKSSFSPHLGVA
jgi:hypothetical protein